MPKPEPFLARRIDGRIIEANCPICGDPLGLGNEIGSPQEQELKMQAAFDRHMNNRHYRKDDCEAKLDERQASIVEMRFCGGLSIDETSQVLAISPATVKREWMTARSWLYDALTNESC